jgi:hypothetical protein
MGRMAPIGWATTTAFRERRGSAVPCVAFAAVAILVATGCHQSNDIVSPWASLGGLYRAAFVLPCRAQDSADVMVTQRGSQASAVIPGFGHVECTAAPSGQVPRVTTAAVTLDVGCGSTNVTYSYLPMDDGRVLNWDFPDGRGENCGCSGTTTVMLHLTPR